MGIATPVNNLHLKTITGNDLVDDKASVIKKVRAFESEIDRLSWQYLT